MRPRIRTIKPEAFTDEKLWDLEQECGLPVFRAFTGLWCFADREGRFEWRTRPLKAGILPYWDGDFSRVLDALATRGLIRKYVSDGREYGYIPGFAKHQFVNGKEPKSDLPEPLEFSEITDGSRVVDASSTRDERVDIHAPSHSLPIPIPIPNPFPGGVQGGQLTVAQPAPKKPRGSKTVPDAWQPTDEHRALAAQHGTSFDLELQRFRLCVFRRSYAPSEWDARFSSWILDKGGSFSQQRPQKPAFDPMRWANGQQ